MVKENGFAIAEFLVALSLMGMISLGALMVTGQTLKVPGRASDWATAVRQAQNVGYWVSRDALMASTVIGDDPDTTATEFITLSWKEFQSGVAYKVHYRLTWHDMDERNWVERFVEVTPGSGPGSTGQTLIAKNIDSAGYVLDPATYRIKLTVQSSSGSRVISRDYKIDPRVNYAE